MQERPAPLVIGHRGASGYRPEHTSAAYELAFDLGADAVEPDIVPTKDGILVLRHENDISTTTDVADRPEFAQRRTTKSVDGDQLTGWFTEDFTWEELATLRARERIPSIRQPSSSFDGAYPLLRLADLLELVDRRSAACSRQLGVVAELKHASYFSSIGLPLDELFVAELRRTGWLDRDGLVVESFESTVLGQLRRRGYPGPRVYLLEAEGAPADRVASQGSDAAPYSEDLTDEGLHRLSDAPVEDRIDGISVHLSMLGHANADPGDDRGEGGSDGARGDGDAGREHGIVRRAHLRGLSVYAWTLRPENRFLPKRLRRGSDPAAYGGWAARFGEVMRCGVDGVFADHPDLAVVARERLGGDRGRRCGRDQAAGTED